MTNQLVISIANSVEDAPDYKKSDVKPATLFQAVVVRNGTKQGNDTVDLVFADADGNRYVALITARLLKQLGNMVITDRN